MDIERYTRQTLLSQIGSAGQRRLADSRVLLVGCGALGTVIAEQLVRAGVGLLRVVDRDLVELSNLQRQVLFDEEDARQSLPKAVAAANRLRRINSQVTVEPIVADVNAGNVEELADVTLILDGTDNADTRYLINDVSIKHNIPWIYGACVGTEGRVMSVLPNRSACLRCIFPEPPNPGEIATCDTAGVLGPAAGVVASLQSAAAIRLLAVPDEPEAGPLLAFDVWSGRFRLLHPDRITDCPACGRKQFQFLDNSLPYGTTSLCGRNAVQIRPPAGVRLDLEALELRLGGVGEVRRTPYFLRFRLPQDGPVELTVFPDGRSIVFGTDDQGRARSYYARYVGS